MELDFEIKQKIEKIYEQYSTKKMADREIEHIYANLKGFAQILVLMVEESKK